jgi:hypothetical protein
MFAHGMIVVEYDILEARNDSESQILLKMQERDVQANVARNSMDRMQELFGSGRSLSDGFWKESGRHSIKQI